MNGTRVTDAGLAHLTWVPGLDWLALDNTGVGDAGLAGFQGMPRLWHVSLVGTRFTDTGERALRNAIPNLVIIR